MKATSMTICPIWMSAVPLRGQDHAHNSASMPERAKASMITWFARTPSMRAMVKFSAAAAFQGQARALQEQRQRNEHQRGDADVHDGQILNAKAGKTQTAGPAWATSRWIRACSNRA